MPHNSVYKAIASQHLLLSRGIRADLSHEPLSRIELEAALGACREKALELELRLKNAEERMHLQVRPSHNMHMPCL